MPLTQNQFDALVDFVFNIGGGNFGTSTLLRKVNASDFLGAAAEFLRWDRLHGVEVPGLLRRRQAEANLFQTA
jgi:lysozyme